MQGPNRDDSGLARRAGVGQGPPRARWWVLGAVCIGLAVLACGAARGERLALRCYGQRDGLSHNRVSAILQDGRGYLWIGTWEGLSRFDGYDFVSFGASDGLGHPLVNALAEDEQGRLWVATNGGGISLRLDAMPTAPGARVFCSTPIDRSAESNQINAVASGKDGSLWLASDAGIYRAWRTSGQPSRTVLVEKRQPLEPLFESVRVASDGAVWYGAARDLVEWRDGVTVRHPLPGRNREVVAIVELEPRLLIALEDGLYEADPAGSGATLAWRRLPPRFAPDQRVYAAKRDSRGRLWVGTRQGLIEIAGRAVQTFTRAEGLPDDHVRSLAEDREGNIWFGTNSAGVCKIPAEPIRSFGPADGLPDADVVALREGPDGSIYASTQHGGVAILSGDRFIGLEGAGPASRFRSIGRRLFFARDGAWWAGTDEGVFRGHGSKLRPEQGRKVAIGQGAPLSDNKFSIHQDGRNQIWIVAGTLQRCAPASSRCVQSAGAPLLDFSELIGASCDAAGCWLAGYSTFARWFHGRVQRFRMIPSGAGEGVRALFRDHRGWLWIGLRYSGVAVTTDPEADHPSFRLYDSSRGLSSDTVWAIGEDRRGRIYLGTGRGLDIVEPQTGRIRSLSSADGLAGDLINDVLVDRRGRVWVGTASGVSVFDPDAEPPPGPPPPVYFSHVQAGNATMPLSPVGADHLPPFDLPSARSSLLVEFVGLSFRGERSLLYQYRLEGADSVWSRPLRQRLAHYAHIGSGHYRFLVRAVDSDGRASARVASLDFEILPPFWRRPVFLAIGVSLLLLALAGFHRTRVERAVAMERVRGQIATDLHDEIGSGLSQIAILTEVARRGVSGGAAASLGEVAELARAMRESMSEIIWAIDPRRDRVSQLVRRMRQAAFNLLGAEGVEVHFTAPAEETIERLNLSAERRRQFLLIFKEWMTNVARHASARRVEIRVACPPGVVELGVCDDGCGFDPALKSEGHGLGGIRQRAAELEAGLEISSAPGRGACLSLSMPLRVRKAGRRGSRPA
jgi:ligand-binding sensor domain-containing protein/signal transduction histidine kinase